MKYRISEKDTASDKQPASLGLQMQAGSAAGGRTDVRQDNRQWERYVACRMKQFCGRS